MKIKKMFSVTLALALLLQIFALALPVSAETVDETDTSSTGAGNYSKPFAQQILMYEYSTSLRYDSSDDAYADFMFGILTLSFEEQQTIRKNFDRSVIGYSFFVQPLLGRFTGVEGDGRVTVREDRVEYDLEGMLGDKKVFSGTVYSDSDGLCRSSSWIRELRDPQSPYTPDYPKIEYTTDRDLDIKIVTYRIERGSKNYYVREIHRSPSDPLMQGETGAPRFVMSVACDAPNSHFKLSFSDLEAPLSVEELDALGFQPFYTDRLLVASIALAIFVFFGCTAFLLIKFYNKRR